MAFLAICWMLLKVVFIYPKRKRQREKENGHHGTIIKGHQHQQRQRGRGRRASPASVEDWQALASNELAIVHEASMNVSLYLYPPTSLPLASTIIRLVLICFSWMVRILTFPSRETISNTCDSLVEENKTNDAWNHRRLKLLQWISTPAMNKNKANHLDRLRVLGSALWYRQHFQGPVSAVALAELLQTKALASASSSKLSWSESSLSPSSLGNTNKNDTDFGLSTMKHVILWASMPRDRRVISHCLDGLAFLASSSSSSSSNTQTNRNSDVEAGGVSAFPIDVLTLLLEEIIIQSNDECGDPVPIPTHQQQQQPAMSTRANTKREHAQAMRIFGYLHLLDVLIPSNTTYSAAASPFDDEGDSSDGVSDTTCTSSRRLLPVFRLRPGILRNPKASQSWVTPFLTRLLEKATEDFAEQEPQAKDQVHSSVLCREFLLCELPTLMMKMHRFEHACQLLNRNQVFANARMQLLGLQTTVECYLQEWTNLIKFKRESLLLGEGELKASSPIVSWLCDQCLSRADEATAPLWQKVNSFHSKRLEIRAGLAESCYGLGIFLLASPIRIQTQNSITTAAQLLHQARHLQVLVLGERCRRLARAVNNLATTLHVHTAFPNKKNKNTRASRSKARSANSDSSPDLPTRIFEQSYNLLTMASQMRREDDMTLEDIALEVGNILEKVWLNLQPVLLVQADELRQTIKVSKFGTASLPNPKSGVLFRKNMVFRQLQLAYRGFRSFVDVQLALCQLPCSAEMADKTGSLACLANKVDLVHT